MTMLDVANVSNIAGVPFLNHSPGVMRMLSSPLSFARRSDSVTMKTFAVEPRWVPLPPMPTPIASDHHSGETLMPCCSIPRMMGTIAAVNGILSIIADRIAALHINIIEANSRSDSR